MRRQTLSLVLTTFCALLTFAAATGRTAPQNVVNPHRLGAAGGGTYTPPASLQLWVKADAAVYEDSGATDPAENNDSVLKWIDQTSNAHVGTGTGNGGGQPTFLTNQQNGLPVVRCFQDASTHHVSFPDHATIELNTDSTIIAVVRQGSTGNPNYLVSKFTNSVASAYSYYINNSNKPAIDRPWIAGGTQGTNAISNATFYVLTARVSGTTVNHWTSGVANGSSSLVTGNNTADPLIIGVSGGTMDFGEVMIFNAALSQAEREAAEDYLGTRWAITVTH